MITSFRNGGRIAGMGMSYDNYDDESYGGGVNEKRYDYRDIRFPNDNVKPEDLNGPIICYKEKE